MFIKCSNIRKTVYVQLFGVLEVQTKVFIDIMAKEVQKRQYSEETKIRFLLPKLYENPLFYLLDIISGH